MASRAKEYRIFLQLLLWVKVWTDMNMGEDVDSATCASIQDSYLVLVTGSDPFFLYCIRLPELSSAHREPMLSGSWVISIVKSDGTKSGIVQARISIEFH